MKDQIIKAIEQALKRLHFEGEVILTQAKGHGDFATNIAMKLAKILNNNPIIIAQKIADQLKAEFIDKVEVAPPGFINIFLHKNIYGLIVQKVLNENDNYGKGNQGKYINVEYVSANPTGYLHIGHASIAALGGSLSAILKFAGNRVDQEFYINDAGNQIEMLGISTFIRYQQLCGKQIQLPSDGYHADEIIDVAKKLVIKFENKYKNAKFADVKDIFTDFAKQYMLRKIKQHLQSFGIVMDIYYSEKTLYEQDLIKKSLKKIPSIYEKDGATWIQTTKFGDDKDRVVIKSDKTFTYFAPDIAYHDVKLSRGYDELINIWGADHLSYALRMKIALQELGLPAEKLDILIIQMVRLIKDGKEFKMSKRSGTAFTLNDLINLVGKDAARFYLVNRSTNTKLDFDIALARKKSNDNHVFTLQYTHARANQVLQKSMISPTVGHYQEKEIEIINLISKFPDLILKIASTHRVNLLPQYLIELAQLFNSFYSNHKIIGSDREAALLALTTAVRQILATGLDLLGVNAPAKM